MWNWKLMFEDREVVCYCDIDSIIDPEEDENGIYRSAECYQSISGKVAAWMSIYIKNKATAGRYIEERKRMGLPIDRYEDFNNVLCVVEIDPEKEMYRVIPAMDYDNMGNELAGSTALDDEGSALFRGRIKGDWSPIKRGKTHKAIQALYKFVYG